MPLIKSAIKKVRKDKTRTKKNLLYIKAYKDAIKKHDIKKAYSAIDKAVKRKVIHKNKANRLKSGISKFLKKSIKTKTSK